MCFSLQSLERRLLFSAAYTIDDLGTLGGDDVHAHDINIEGQVVGWAKIANGDDHAFFWSKKKGIRDLHVPSWDGILTNNPSTDGPSFALAINDHGMIAIKSATQYSAFGVSQTFVYWHGVLSKISSPSHSTAPVDINNRGDILMQGSDETMMAAMVIIKEGNRQARAVVEGIAYAINDRGMMIAYPDYETAPISAHDKARLLPHGFALSDHAAVLEGYNHHQYSLIVRHGRSSLSFAEESGKLSVVANQINNQAVFVGTAGVTQSGSTTNFPVVRDGTILRDLNSLIPANSGWKILTANAINDKGQIAGEGLHDGKNRAFLLTPIPGAHPPATPGPTDVKLKLIKKSHHRRLKSESPSVDALAFLRFVIPRGAY